MNTIHISETARILQISSTESVIYKMPLEVYGFIRDILDWWPVEHSRRDKGTVEKAIVLLEKVWPGVRAEISVKREETKPEIRGVLASIAILDDYQFFEEGKQ